MPNSMLTEEERADIETVRSQGPSFDETILLTIIHRLDRAACEAQRELVEERSHLRGIIREIGRLVVEKTGCSVSVTGGLGDALHWEDVHSLVRDCLTLALAADKERE